MFTTKNRSYEASFYICISPSLITGNRLFTNNGHEMIQLKIGDTKEEETFERSRAYQTHNPDVDFYRVVITSFVPDDFFGTDWVFENLQAVYKAEGKQMKHLINDMPKIVESGQGIGKILEKGIVGLAWLEERVPTAKLRYTEWYRVMKPANSIRDAFEAQVSDKFELQFGNAPQFVDFMSAILEGGKMADVGGQPKSKM